MCELLVGLGDVDLVGIGDGGGEGPLQVAIRSRRPRPSCEGCGERVWSKGYRTAVLVDLRGVRPAGASAVAETSLDVSESWVCASARSSNRTLRLVQNGRC